MCCFLGVVCFNLSFKFSVNWNMIIRGCSWPKLKQSKPQTIVPFLKRSYYGLMREMNFLLMYFSKPKEIFACNCIIILYANIESENPNFTHNSAERLDPKLIKWVFPMTSGVFRSNQILVSQPRKIQWGSTNLLITPFFFKLFLLRTVPPPPLKCLQWYS